MEKQTRTWYYTHRLCLAALRASLVTKDLTASLKAKKATPAFAGRPKGRIFLTIGKKKINEQSQIHTALAAPGIGTHARNNEIAEALTNGAPAGPRSSNSPGGRRTSR